MKGWKTVIFGLATAIVPAALTYSLIEGFVLQSMIQGTGLAMLEMAQSMAPAPARTPST